MRPAPGRAPLDSPPAGRLRDERTDPSDACNDLEARHVPDRKKPDPEFDHALRLQMAVITGE